MHVPLPEVHTHKHLNYINNKTFTTERNRPSSMVKLNQSSLFGFKGRPGETVLSDMKDSMTFVCCEKNGNFGFNKRI